MGINIKNAETEQRIRELAQRTGEGKTEAVDTAVRERLERLDTAQAGQKRRDRMREILDELAPRLKDMPDIDSYLYDPVTGLPK